MDAADETISRASRLLGCFHSEWDRFAAIRPVEGADVPQPYRTLLDHRSHMTVAMERHHGGPVRLRVVRVANADEAGRYAREILLEGPDGEIVQYGIVKLDLDAVDAGIAAAIRAADVPLGRLLIDSGMLREVHRVRLFEVEPGADLGRLMGCGVRHTYGRVAEISLSGKPALELLEIAAPQRS
ncbi:MAG: hypothetical protein ACKOEX_01435 [Planctomycetia bacterium]